MGIKLGFFVFSGENDKTIVTFRCISGKTDTCINKFGYAFESIKSTCTQHFFKSHFMLSKNRSYVRLDPIVSEPAPF